MIIACPSCSAKYQLADSKIKASGTKVRCPRCSHTFTVYREQKADEDDPLSERTELFIRREESLAKQTTLDEKANLRQKENFDESVFDQKTTVSAPPPTPQENQNPPPKASEPRRSEKPKQDPARILTPEAFNEASEEETFPQSQAHDFGSGFADNDLHTSSEIKPFGDATLFEIQKGSKKRTSNKLVKIAALTAAVAVLVFIGQIFFNKNLYIQEEKAVTEVDIPYELNRPVGWYKDDPQVYQDTLAQIAALPPQEQERPENRALLAETLILSGLLTGATDQVISGMGFSSSLVVSHPMTPLGYYGIAAYALWNEDRRTLQDLVDRWPEAYRDDPEFLLVEFVNFAVNKNYSMAFKSAQALLKDEPDFQRANDFALAFALRQPRIAAEFFSPSDIDRMKAKYKRHRALLERELSSLPKWQRDIDSLLGDGSESLESSKKSETPDSSTKSETSDKPEKKAAALIPPEKTFPKEETASSAETTKKPPVKTAPKSNPSRLPPPSANLIAQNKITERQRQDAARLFENGNNLYKAGKTEEALKAYRDALKLDPEFAEIYKRIGMIYMSRQEPERALRSFKIYLQLNPESDDKKLVEDWISSLQ